jgi:hypothetical protein
MFKNGTGLKNAVPILYGRSCPGSSFAASGLHATKLKEKREPHDPHFFTAESAALFANREIFSRIGTLVAVAATETVKVNQI